MSATNNSHSIIAAIHPPFTDILDGAMPGVTCTILDTTSIGHGGGGGVGRDAATQWGGGGGGKSKEGRSNPMGGGGGGGGESKEGRSNPIRGGSTHSALNSFLAIQIP